MKKTVFILLLLLFAGAARAADVRIVSQSPYITSTLQYLGLGDRIVGVSRYDSVVLPKTGGVTDPDRDAISALHPDYLFVSDWTSPEVLKAVTPEGTECVVLHGFRSMKEVAGNLKVVCDVLGIEGGERKAAAFDRNWREAASEVNGAGRRVLVLSSCKGSPFSFGVNTYLHDLFSEAGFRVVEDYPTIRHLRPSEPVQTVEELFARTSPEIVFVLNDDGHGCPVKIGNGMYRVVLLKGEHFVSPSPRILAGLEALKREFGIRKKQQGSL